MHKLPSLSIAVYLKKIKDPETKKKLVANLQVITDLGKEISSKIQDNKSSYTFEDCCMIYGQAESRLWLLKEYNRRLMTFATSYQTLIPWPKELYDLRELLSKQVSIGRELIRAYVQNEIMKKS
jgi:hypothetical protein